MAGYIGSKVAVVSSGAERKKVFTATSGQTSFTGLSYTVNNVHVFQNGVRLVDGTDYTATDGNSLTLTVGASADDQVVVVSYSGFQTSDTVSSSAGGTFSNAVTIDADGSTVLTVDRATSDGTIIDLQKSGSSVGNIGVNGRLTIDGASDGVGLYFGGSALLPRESGSITDGTVGLGGSTQRFTDLYLSGGVYLGGTGSANYLDSYEAGSFTPTVADAISGGNTSPSYSTRVGFYTKVGRNVNINITVSNISTSGLTSGNTLCIQGLPFLQSNTNGRSCTGSVRADRLNVDSTCFGVVALVGQGSSTIQLYQNRDNTTDTAVEIGDIVSGVADLFISINYDT